MNLTIVIIRFKSEFGLFSCFQHRFESRFGANRSIPAANATRWNSTYNQLKALLKLDHHVLTEVCSEEFNNVVFTTREWSQLGELADILAPFSEATDLTQGTESVYTVISEVF